MTRPSRQPCRCGNPTAPGVHRMPGSPVEHCDAQADKRPYRQVPNRRLTRLETALFIVCGGLVLMVLVLAAHILLVEGL